MFDWIRDFLDERTIQVRVRSELSSTRILENGIAQGAMISPLLFICMINDLPDILTNTETSLLANDSAILKSGKNLAFLQKTVQKCLDAVHAWCIEWGFTVSLEKTVVVVFSMKIEKMKYT